MAADLGTLQLDVRARLDNLDRDMRDVRQRAGRGGEDAGEEAGDGMGRGFSKGKAALAAGGAALGVAAFAGFKNALDNEQANANFAASLGLDANQSAAVGKIAGELYADNFGSSLEEINTAIGAIHAADLVNINGPKADIEDLTGKVLTLADVFEVDMPKAVNTLGVIVKNGLAKDSKEGIDLLTAGLQQVAPSLREDLIDSLNEYSVFFGQLGLNGSEAIASLTMASKGGAISIDKIGDAMKELTIRAVDGSKLTTEALTGLGLDADKIAQGIAAGGDSAKSSLKEIVSGLDAVEDPVKRTQLGVALFGTQFEDLGTNAMPSLKSLSRGLEDVEGAAGKMVDTVGGTNAAKLETFKRSMEQNVTNVMGKAVSMIEKLPGPLQTVTSGFVGLLPMVAPLIPVFAAFIPVILGTGTAAGAASFSLGAMAASLWAVMAPVLAVIAVIAALIAIGYLIVHNWDTIKEAAIAVWGAISGFVMDKVHAVGEFLSNTWESIKTAAASAWQWVQEKVDGFLSFFTELPGKIGAAASGMWDGIKDAFRSAINFIIRGWNGMQFRIPGFHIGPVGFDGFTLGLPNIPLLDSGGIATGPTLAALSINRKPEAIIPLDRLESMMGLSASERSSPSAGGVIVVQGNLHYDREMDDALRKRLDDVDRWNGNIGVRGGRR